MVERLGEEEALAELALQLPQLGQLIGCRRVPGKMFDLFELSKDLFQLPFQRAVLLNQRMGRVSRRRELMRRLWCKYALQRSSVVAS